MNTMPRFTAEFSLYTANDRYTGSGGAIEAGGVGKIVPQQMRVVREADAGHCHCPCCLEWHGQLVCC